MSSLRYSKGLACFLWYICFVEDLWEWFTYFLRDREKGFTCFLGDIRGGSFILISSTWPIFHPAPSQRVSDHRTEYPETPGSFWSAARCRVVRDKLDHPALETRRGADQDEEGETHGGEPVDHETVYRSAAGDLVVEQLVQCIEGRHRGAQGWGDENEEARILHGIDAFSVLF